MRLRYEACELAVTLRRFVVPLVLRVDRVCPFGCVAPQTGRGVVEDPSHAVCDCPIYDVPRRRALQALCDVVRGD